MIKNHIDILKSKKDETRASFSKKLEGLDKAIESLELKKKRVLDLYADSTIDKYNYISKIEEIDSEIKKNVSLKGETTKTLSTLGSRSEVRRNVNYFCKLAQRRLDKLDFDQKKLFLKQLIDEIVFTGDKLVIKGYIPVLANHQDFTSLYRSRHTISMANTSNIRYEVQVGL